VANILTNGFPAADVTIGETASLWSGYLCDLGCSIYDNVILCSVVAFIQSISKFINIFLLICKLELIKLS